METESGLTFEFEDVESFYVWFDEDNQGFVGATGSPPERLAWYSSCMDDGVARFTSEENAKSWLAPSGLYDHSNATLVRVVTAFTAEAV